jgi:hemolysin-activating ACP:hemolysin acyltransferase|tara:strand:- start:1310 stop:1723 length:414 start_codon:yes stop_codon:yes gene_type:complete
MVNITDIIEVIELYRKFSKYDSYTDKELSKSIIPSLSLSQYKIFKDKKNLKVYGFVSWAFMNKQNKESFLSTGIIDSLDWNTGNNLVFIDLIGTKNIKQIFDWSVNKASTFDNIEKEFNWIRVNNNKVKRINTKQIR